MSYKEKPILKLYKYENNTFVLQAIIDDFMECSFERNLYQAGNFTISINYNIPNAQLFQRGLFVQFGNDPSMFGEILSITDSIAQDGKGSQIRIITGKDARYLFKRRVIKNLNNADTWTMTAKGETCLRTLVYDQCGAGAEEKRRLPIINAIPETANAVGKEYTVSESFSNLYDTLVTIATQSEIGWQILFQNNELVLNCYPGNDLSNEVQFSTDFDSLANGTFTDTSESYANTIYVAGKGTGEERDIYEGEIEDSGNAPSGLDRYEAFDNQSSMTTESEYEAEALSMLSQYGQTVTIAGNGLAKCPYIFKEQYDVGDVIKIAFSGKSAKAQILSVTEHWAFGQYGITFSFGKPVNNLDRQLQLILKQIQKASNKTTTTSSVKYYTIPTDPAMPKSDVIYDTIGFVGECASDGSTFQLYLDNEKTGAKTYHVYFKQLAGAGKLTLTTGKEGASNLVLNAGTYVAIIYVDENGNVTSQGMTATSAVEAGNNQPVTSDGVNSAIQSATGGLVTGVKGNSESTYRTGNVNITKANIGLGNVDNTSDADKPVSTAQATAISNAINALDVASVGGSSKYISAISETDGKISATAGNISGTVTSGDNAPVSGGAVADILSSLPTDAVLHYSFDEVPDYPDGTAVYKHIKDFTSTIEWNVSTNNATYSVNNGVASWTLTNTSQLDLLKNIPNIAGKLFKIKFQSSISGREFRVIGKVGSTYVRLATYITNGNWQEVVLLLRSDIGETFILSVTNNEINSKLEIESIYIGDGSYSTPIIDNANGQNNATNYGGIAAQGVSGKGAYFLNGKYANLGLVNLTNNFTISLWVKPDNNTTGLQGDILVKTSQIVIRNGSSSLSKSRIYLYDSNGTQFANIPDLDILPAQWNHFVIVKSNTSFKVYLSTEKKIDVTLSSASININSNNMLLCNNINTRSQSIDDLLIFDRALTEKEVVALYYNKANTPKYYNLNNYKLPAPPTMDGSYTLNVTVSGGKPTYSWS